MSYWWALGSDSKKIPEDPKQIKLELRSTMPIIGHNALGEFITPRPVSSALVFRKIKQFVLKESLFSKILKCTCPQ